MDWHCLHDEPGPGRFRFLAGLVAVAALLLWTPLGLGPPAQLGGTDSLYHLFRAQECLAHQNLTDRMRVPSVDPYLHVPTGYRVHWPAAYAVLHATLAGLVGCDGSDLKSLLTALAWVPSAAGLLALLVVLALARACGLDRRLSLAAGLVAVLSPAAYAAFQYGEIDHHWVSILGVSLAVLGLLRASPVAWCGGLALLLLLTPDALFYATLLLAAAAARQAYACRDADPPCLAPAAGWLLTPAVSAWLALVVNRWFETDPLPWRAMDWSRLSLFHVGWLGLLGVGAWCALGLETSGRRGALWPRLPAPVRIGFLASGVLVLAVLYLNATGAADAVSRRLLATDRVLVAEEMSPLRYGWLAAGLWEKVLTLAGLYHAVRLLLAWRRREPVAVVAVHSLWLAATLLGFIEYRHLRVVCPVLAVGVCAAAAGTVRALGALPLFAEGRGRWLPAGLVGALVGGSLLASTVPQAAQARRQAPADARRLAPLLDWFRTATPAPTSSGPSGRPDDGVLCPWSMGHQIRVLAARPVLVDPFNHLGVEERLRRVWLASDEASLVAGLGHEGGRYLVLSDPLSAIVNQLGSAPADVALRAPDLPGGVVFRPEARRFAIFALYLGLGVDQASAHLQPRYWAPTDTAVACLTADGRIEVRPVPTVQVFEVRRGATVAGRVPPGGGPGPVRVEFTVRAAGADGRDRACAWSVPVAADGRFAFRTALPAPVRETTFAVVTPYRLHVGVRTVELAVPQQAVDDGLELRVPEAP